MTKFTRIQRCKIVFFLVIAAIVLTGSQAWGQTGEIIAHKFNDLNGNGIQDAGEPSLAGWTIHVYTGSDCNAASLIAAGVTDDLGSVSFSLSANTYFVSETLKAGWLNTTNLCQDVILPDEGFETVNFGNHVVLATGNPSSYKVTVTKVEMWNGASWVTLFSGAVQLDMVAGGTFPGIGDLSLPAGTYTQVRVTFNNSFPVAGTLNNPPTPYYTTATTFGGQANLASTPTTVAGSMAEFTFRIDAWGALNADVPEKLTITPPITVGPTTDYQPTLRFGISDTLLLKGAAGTPSTYYFALSAPTVSIVEP